MKTQQKRATVYFDPDIHRALRVKAAETDRSISENPRPPACEKLSGQDKYRLRQGCCRIVYSIEDQDLVVYVVKVGHRKDVYR